VVAARDLHVVHHPTIVSRTHQLLPEGKVLHLDDMKTSMRRIIHPVDRDRRVVVVVGQVQVVDRHLDDVEDHLREEVEDLARWYRIPENLLARLHSFRVLRKICLILLPFEKQPRLL
jgi:hypothetical protein